MTKICLNQLLRYTSCTNNGSNNLLCINKNRTSALEYTADEAIRVFINFTGQIFALDSAVDKIQNLLSSHGCFLTKPMYRHM